MRGTECESEDLCWIVFVAVNNLLPLDVSRRKSVNKFNITQEKKYVGIDSGFWCLLCLK